MIKNRSANKRLLQIISIRPPLAALFLLVVLTFSVYCQISSHEFLTNWDDGFYVTGNEAVQGFSWDHIATLFSRFYVGNYAPVQMLSYLLDFQFWGLRPGAFLFTNLVIHLANGILVYRLLLSLHDDRIIAWIGAAIFLLHPVQVESVAWVSQRKNLLAMLFFLLAWEGYRRYRDALFQYRISAYAVSLTAFVLALLSKSVAVIFPVVMILDDVCFSKQWSRRMLVNKLPFFIVAAGAALLALQSQQYDDSVWGGGGGRAITYPGGSAVSALYTMLPVICKYLGLLVWPAGLSVEYDLPVRSTIDSQVIYAVLLLACLALFGVRLFRSDRKRGFWILFFIVALLPVSQIVPLVTLMNDRYLYFPMLSVAALSGSGAVWLFQKSGKRKALCSFLLIAILAALSYTTFQRVGVWKDAITLWSDAVKKSPLKSSTWEELGEAYQISALHNQQLYRPALDAYARAAELDPLNDEPLYNSGLIFIATGEYEKAREVLLRLIYIDPDHIRGLVALGDSYRKSGNLPEAQRYYSQAEFYQPEVMEVLLPLAGVSLELGQLDEARSYLMRAEAIGGEGSYVAYQLACLESLSGRTDEALAWLEKALQRGYQDKQGVIADWRLSDLTSDRRFSDLLGKYFP